MVNKKILGISGETLAAEFLRKRGYRILLKNFRCRAGEIDLIAKQGGTLCFIEVKTRQGHSQGEGMEAVTWHKQRRMIRAAQFFLLTRGIEDTESPVRFDVVSIEMNGRQVPAVQLIQNAFEAAA